MENTPHNLLEQHGVEVGVESFFHTGVTFDEKLYEVTFSEEARAEFQQLVDRIQSSFVMDQDDTEAGGSDTDKSHKEITVEDMATAVDGMIVAGKGKKTVKRFMERVKNVLGKKQKGGKYTENHEKIEKQVKRYKDHPRIQVTIQYHEGGTLKNLDDTPITVWPGQDIHTMLISLNARLRFKQLISSKKSPN